jgi:hypothetical protein
VKLIAAVVVGVVVFALGSMVAGLVLWPVFRVAEGYSVALGPSGPLAMLIIAVTGPFFGGVFGSYWPLRWFSGIDPTLFRGVLIGIVAAGTLLITAYAAWGLPASGWVLVGGLALVQVGTATGGLAVGAQLHRDKSAQGSA